MKYMTFAMAVGVMAGVAFAGAPVELKNAGFHQTDGKGGAVGWSHHPNWHAEKAGHNGLGALVWECASESEIKNGGPGDAFEPAWARTKAMAEEFKKYIDVFLSVDSAPAVSSSNGDVAVRAWRYKGETYLLAENCTTNAQTATLTLSENVGNPVSSDFGPAPKIKGRTLSVALGPIEYVMLRFRNSCNSRRSDLNAANLR